MTRHTWLIVLAIAALPSSAVDVWQRCHEITDLPSYGVRFQCGPSGDAVLSSSGIPDLRAAAPSDFDGTRDAWSSEHLLIAAVQSCFLLTLRGVARASKREFLRLEFNATGTVNRENGVTHFTDRAAPPADAGSRNGSRGRASHPGEEREELPLEPEIPEG